MFKSRSLATARDDVAGGDVEKRGVVIMVQIFMRFAGFLFLSSGWLIVLAAVTLLKSSALAGFVLTGLVVQILGLTLVVRTHVLPHGEKR
jgi:hypothetical protein